MTSTDRVKKTNAKATQYRVYFEEAGELKNVQICAINPTDARLFINKQYPDASINFVVPTKFL